MASEGHHPVRPYCSIYRMLASDFSRLLSWCKLHYSDCPVLGVSFKALLISFFVVARAWRRAGVRATATLPKNDHDYRKQTLKLTLPAEVPGRAAIPRNDHVHEEGTPKLKPDDTGIVMLFQRPRPFSMYVVILRYCRYFWVPPPSVHIASILPPACAGSPSCFLV